MTLGLNKAMLVGVIARVPELRYTPEGKPVAGFSVQTQYGWTTTDGTPIRSIEWFNVIVWGPLAESCIGRLDRGNLVYVEGRFQTRHWISRTGGRHRQATEVIAGDIIPLGEASRYPTKGTGPDDVMDAGHVNRMMIIGRLEREPELRLTSHGKPVSCLNVLVSHGRATLNRQREAVAEQIHVVAWGRLAEQTRQRLSAGQVIYVEGHLQNRRWLGKDGHVRERTEIVARDVVPLGRRQTDDPPGE